VKALQALEGGLASGAYNLGNGRGFSVHEVIEATRRMTGREILEVTGPRRWGDPPALISDAAKAKNDLGWQPSLTDLADILGTAWAWHQRHAPKRSTASGVRQDAADATLVGRSGGL
jgi:UDP-glucose 4-epimerase